jgi:carboxypeptidase C (cathepsin A)
MLAFMQEHGPFLMDVGAKDFRYNDYSWNKKANVLYIE